MPMYRSPFPVGITNPRAIDKNGVVYTIELGVATHTVTGVDGAEVILPLCGGDEFVGDVLEYQFEKGWDADIDTFTARVDSGDLELTGVAAIAGTWSDGWINGQYPITLLDEVEITVALLMPTDDTGAVANRDIRLQFFLREEKEVNDPETDPNNIRLSCDVDETGILYIIRKERAGVATQLFDGSTYDDGSARATGDLEATIWRFVFHNGHAGEASPSDDRHVHIYLKQSDTMANAETATENELTTSPFDLSDLLFNVAYPAYRIRTQNATYFGTAMGSANRAESSYLRVVYPDFDLKYEIADADRYKGQVEIWDGDPDSGGIRVYDEDHEFSGDCYIQNGLIRLHIDDGAVTGLKLYYYTGAAWSRGFSHIHFHLNATATPLHYPFYKRTILVSNEKIIIEVKHCEDGTDDDDYYVISYITIKRGSYTIEADPRRSYPLDDIYTVLYDVTNLRFGVVGDIDAHGIGDDDLDLTANNTTMTDNTLIAFDDAQEAVIGVHYSNKKPAAGTVQIEAYDGGHLYIIATAIADIEDTIFYFGEFPYTLIANLFEEAEDGTLGGGATVQPDATASGGQVAQMNAQNESVRIDLTAGTHLPEGRYYAIVRLKDTNQVASDIYIAVTNSTDGVNRNEANEPVYRTAAPASAWTYYAVVFDVTAQDVSDGDNIRILVAKILAAANVLDCDYFLIVPISNGENWPQDLAHAALRERTQVPRVFER